MPGVKKTGVDRRSTLILLAVSLLIALLILEGVSRVIMSRMFHDPRIFTEDPHTSFALIPGKVDRHSSREYQVSYHINEQGFRGNPVPVPKQADTRHVLVLGDSFVFGVGVDEGEDVSTRLQELYDKNQKGRNMVINAGFAAGTSPDDAHAFLASSRGRALEADLVIEMVFVRNDLRDVNEHTWVEQDGDGFPLVVRSARDFPNSLSARGPVPYYKSHPVLSRLAFVQLAMRAYFALVELPRLNRSIQATQAMSESPDMTKLNTALTGLHRTATSQGARFVVAIIPTRDQVLGRDAPFYDKILDGLVSHMSDSGMPYIILNSARTGLTADDYWPHDSHWKPSGHEKVATTLFQALQGGDD